MKIMNSNLTRSQSTSLIVVLAWLTMGSAFTLPLACGQCTAVQTAKLVAEDTIRLGDSGVAVLDSIAIVGHQNDNLFFPDSGSAYLFDTATGEPIVELYPNDPAYSGRFGYCVAIVDNIAIVGSPGADDYIGAVYLFDTTTHQQVAKLSAEDGQEGDDLGRSVAVAGDMIIAGAKGVDDDTGAAYLFNITTGQQLHKLLPDDGAAEDEFGSRNCIAIDGSFAIVGAWRDDNENGVDAGAAYLFDTNTGQQLAKLLPDDGAAGDRFGRCAILGNRAVITAVFDDDNGEDSGSAYVFDISTGEQLAMLMPDDGAAGDNFGGSVSISGNIAVIGSWRDDDIGENSGAAYLFDINTGQQLGKILPDDGDEFDNFGRDVFISEDVVIAAALGDDDSISSHGSAYLFNISDCKILLGDVNADGEVNLLDVQPFIVLLQNSGYQGEADINQDGAVDLLDVLPFVELLGG